MRKLIVFVPFLLVACSYTPEELAKNRHEWEKEHQEDFRDKPLVCRDNVEYIYMPNAHGASATPHYKPDGTLFTCKEK